MTKVVKLATKPKRKVKQKPLSPKITKPKKKLIEKPLTIQNPTEETKTEKNDLESTPNLKTDTFPTLFVGNLAKNTKKNQLLKLFTPYGKVKSVRLRSSTGLRIKTSYDLKKTVGLIGYVVFENRADAENALSLNGSKFKESIIRVNFADKSTLVNGESKRTIFIGNLKYCTTDEDLHEVFKSCGSIEYVRTLQCDKGCKGIGYVCFKSADAIPFAMEMNKTMVHDRPIHVEIYSHRKIKVGAKMREAKLAANVNDKKLPEKKISNTKKSKDKNIKDSKSKVKFTGAKYRIKKKLKTKKTSQMQKLAKKIAPR